MLDDRPIVLVAGSGRSSFERLAPVLDRQKLEVIQVTSAEDAARLAYSERVDLVILDAEPATMSLEEIVGTIRAGWSASNKTSLLVLAPPGRADAALALVGRGVNRVMLAGDPPALRTSEPGRPRGHPATPDSHGSKGRYVARSRNPKPRRRCCSPAATRSEVAAA